MDRRTPITIDEHTQAPQLVLRYETAYEHLLRPEDRKPYAAMVRHLLDIAGTANVLLAGSIPNHLLNPSSHFRDQFKYNDIDLVAFAPRASVRDFAAFYNKHNDITINDCGFKVISPEDITAGRLADYLEIHGLKGARVKFQPSPTPVIKLHGDKNALEDIFQSPVTPSIVDVTLLYSEKNASRPGYKHK